MNQGKLTARFLLLLHFVGTYICYGQLYTYQKISHKNGLPVAATWGLAEKEDGGILIGTSGAGVIEYDGTTFKELIDKDEDNLHIVTGIYPSNKDIYFTSIFKGLFKLLENGKIEELISAGQLPNANGLYAFQDKLYIPTDIGLSVYELHTKKSHFILKYDGKERFKVKYHFVNSEYLLLFTTHGNYIATPDGKFSSLSTYFNTSSAILKDAPFGYAKDGLLYLFDRTFKKGWLIHLKKGVFNYKEKEIRTSEDLSGLIITKAIYNRSRGCFAMVSNDGTIYEECQFTLTKKLRNTQAKTLDFKEIIVDYNGDYWATSDLSGLYKISIQPFTKVETMPAFENNNIMFIHRTAADNFILSTFKSETFHGNPSKEMMRESTMRIYCSAIVNGKHLIGTANGIFEYNDKNNTFTPVQFEGLHPNTRIQHIASSGNSIWISVYNEGLRKFDLQYRLVREYGNTASNPSIAYTSQLSEDGKYIYFGTSEGIIRLEIARDHFTKLNSQNLGYYCGLSTKDIFGTNWFALDYGLIGISRQGEIFKLSSSKIFPSYLFYTLNSDNNGNLIIGTNKGINVIQINEKGKVLNHRNYDAGTDFEGYETHMRSSFQYKNSTYVGTLEGMFKLDFDYLVAMPSPKKPVITVQKSLDQSNSSVIKLSFLSKNPKTKTVLYSYRINGYQSEWTDLSSQNEFSFINMPGGEYLIEVKATYNGANYSHIATHHLVIEKPIFRNNTILFFFIFIILITNTIFYFRSKRDANIESFYSEEYFTTQNYSELLIIFGIIVHLGASELAPLFNSSIVVNHTFVLITAFLMILCLLGVYRFKNQRKRKNDKIFDVIAFGIMMLYNIVCLHYSALNPYYAFIILLINSVSFLVFEKLRSTLIYVVIFLLTSFYSILTANDFHYDKYILLIPVFISGMISILMNLIRHQSFHQLAFISTIINRSHFIAIAMDQQGKLKFVSKNISNFIAVDSKDLIDESVQQLTQFIHSSDDEPINFLERFEDGKIVNTPIINKDNQIIWFQWTFKEFTNSVRVLIGQDITDKINLENTYEILVENAEDLIYQTDLDGIFQFINNRFTQYLETTKDKLIGKLVFEIIPPDYREGVIQFYRNQIKENKKVSYFELPIIDASGNLQWLGQYVSLLYSTTDHKKAIGFMVVARNITLKLQKDAIIATQSSDIKSSINYARRIQMNLLPAAEKLTQHFDDSFVIYKPKDIVSGDFYWCNQLGNKTIIAVGDGTGHGVPGAFMSILGINLLNSIILEGHINDPGSILDELDERLKQMLSEGNHQKINDGMEITICVIDKVNGTIEYACAGSKLVIHDGENYSVCKGDNKHIGDERPDFTHYITHTYLLNTSTTIYLFTDGYYDQFGGIQHKKYSIRRLLELIMANISLPLSNQGQMMRSEFENWKSENEQTDDVTLIGIRVNNDSDPEKEI